MTSRREMLRLLAAGALSGAAALLGRSRTEAYPCLGNLSACSANTAPCCSENCCGGRCAAKENVCCNGKLCPAGQRCCNGICIDLKSDPKNCGGCGFACRACEICQDGRCLSTCSGTDCCAADGKCVPQGGCPNSDCCFDGSCTSDSILPAFCRVCQNGVAVPCSSIGKCCLRQYNNYVCVAECPTGACCHAGICDQKCGNCEVCQEGVCKACDVAGFCCDSGTCVEQNGCGACRTCLGGKCASCQEAGLVCDYASGTCVKPCAQPKPGPNAPRSAAPASGGCGPCAVCDAVTNTCKPVVCGACLQCDPTTSTCRAIACKPLDQCHIAGICDPATGQCSNPAAANGTPCTGGTCSNGQCGCGPHPACPSGQTCCSNPFDAGSCHDLQSDFANCGSCNHGCNASAQQTCTAGVCCAGFGGFCDFGGVNICCAGRVCIPRSTGASTGLCGCAAPGTPCTSNTVTASGAPCCSGICDTGLSHTCN